MTFGLDSFRQSYVHPLYLTQQFLDYNGAENSISEEQI
jgi:hypothetical protein